MNRTVLVLMMAVTVEALVEYAKLLASVKSNSQTNVPSGANNTRSGNDSTANHYAALLAQVQAQQDAAARRAEELARQKQQAAQAAYDKNMGYLNEAYANRSNLLQQNRSSALQSYNSQLSAAEQQKMAYQMQLEQALANGSAEILQNKYDTLQNLDNAYAQQILALQQAAAQAAQKRW